MIDPRKALAAFLLMAPASSALAAADGYELFRQERFTEAAALFDRDGGDAVTHAAALIRIGRNADALRLIDDSNPRLALLRGAAAFLAAGELGRATTLLDSGLGQWPDDIDFLARRGAVEMRGKRPLKALAYLTRVVELAPKDAGARLALVRALLVAGMPVRVHQAVEAARKAEIAIGPEMMDADLDAMQSFGDHREAVNLAEDYLEDGGLPTATILTRLAISLEAVGSTHRSAERRRQAEAIRPRKNSADKSFDAQPLGEIRRIEAERALERKDWTTAAPLVSEWARVRPDSMESLDAVLNPEIAERIGWGAAFAHLYRVIQRDPTDPIRRLKAVQAHAAPGGSSLLALSHAHTLDAISIAGDSRQRIGQALRERVLARLALLGKIDDLDLESGVIRLVDPAGAMIEARINPESGRLLSFRHGDESIQATWDPTGAFLRQLTDSRGGKAVLTWSEGRVTRIVRSGRYPFDVELDRNGAPVRADGVNVTPAFNATLSTIKAWEAADLDDAIRISLGE